jgi:geranylgeranyl diphosphate synthase type II
MPVRGHASVGRAPRSGSSVGTGELLSHKFLFEEYLASLSFTEETRLATLVGAMRHSLLAGSERLRAVTCMEVAGSFGRDPAEVLPSAAAIELVHTLSSIHGDLPPIAANDLEPGTHPCHEKYGEAIAILAGDAFFGECLALITTRQRGTAEQLLEVVRELAGSTGVNGMVGGQALGLARPVEREALRRVHGYRTGALVQASARIGAILAGATHREQDAVSEYARRLALCFQATEDLLDAASTTEEPGKGAGRGGPGFVRAYGLSGARRLADESLREALKILQGIGGEKEALAELARSVRFRAR